MSTISVEVPVLRPAEESRREAARVYEIPAAAVSARNQTLDAARVIAALGLIWVHTTQSSFSRFHILGRFGTSFFVLAAIFFLFHPLGSSPRPSYGAYALKRFRRLYIPFMTWSLIYLIIRDVKRLVIHEPFLGFGWGRIMGGTSMQFWFLPFIFVACVICFPLPPLLARIGRWKYLLLPLIIAAGSYVALTPRPATPHADDVTNYFLDSAWVFTPAIFWAFALAIVYPLLPQHVRKSPLLALCGIALTIGCLTYLWLIRNSPHPLPSLPRTLAGVGWLLVALVPLHGRLVKLLGPLGKYSYGIFLVHPLFVSSLQSLSHSLNIPTAGWLDVMVAVLAFAASVWLIMLLGSSRWTRWLVP